MSHLEATLITPLNKAQINQMTNSALKSLRISSFNYFKWGHLQALTFVFSNGEQYPNEGTYKVKAPNNAIVKLEPGNIGRINFGVHTPVLDRKAVHTVTG